MRAVSQSGSRGAKPASLLMAETFPFRLIAPTGIVYEGPVEQVIAVGALGEFGVLANHVNYITSILPCVVTLRLNDGSVNEYLVTRGLTEVKDGEMTMLADEAIPVAGIDPISAAPEVQAAEAKLSQMSFYDPGYAEAEQALELARTRAEISHLRRVLH
jgi:F-type H+-transporting ATPase subunit epsilon